MRCPHCCCTRSEVAETRRHNDTIFRRRVCCDCGKSFVTREAIESGMTSTPRAKRPHHGPAAGGAVERKVAAVSRAPAPAPVAATSFALHAVWSKPAPQARDSQFPASSH